MSGICLYPVVDYPGWDNDRHCPTGVWGYADAMGERPVYPPLARELRRQQRLLEKMQRHHVDAAPASATPLD